MSQDQRPGRVRVVSSGAVAPAPQRRRGDPLAAKTVVMQVAGAEVAVAPVSSRWKWVRIVLFLGGAATGGALVTWFDLIGVFAR